MQEAIAEIRQAPLWVQIGLAVWALLFLSFFPGRLIMKRVRFARFRSLARAFGTTAAGRDWPLTFSGAVDGRSYEVRHEYMGGPKSRLALGATPRYVGPTGNVLFTSMPLAGEGWSLMSADVELRRGSGMGRGQPTGDDGFDARFRVVEEGIPVRVGWLDTATRRAFAEFFDAVPFRGPVWIREGRLTYTWYGPTRQLTADALRHVLDRQAHLAAALERRALGIRGPG